MTRLAALEAEYGYTMLNEAQSQTGIAEEEYHGTAKWAGLVAYQEGNATSFRRDSSERSLFGITPNLG